MQKVKTGIPRTEHVWMERITEGGDIYYITSKETRDFYFLYQYDGSKCVKLGKAKTPIELERKYIEQKKR